MCFVCNIVRPRLCRGDSDFDVEQYLNGNLIWELPFGRGRDPAATVPLWADEIIGGWKPERVHLPSTPATRTFVSANPSLFLGTRTTRRPSLIGKKSDYASHVHKASNGTVWAFSATSDFQFWMNS